MSHHNNVPMYFLSAVLSVFLIAGLVYSSVYLSLLLACAAAACLIVAIIALTVPVISNISAGLLPLFNIMLGGRVDGQTTFIGSGWEKNLKGDKVVPGANTLEVELRGSGFLDAECAALGGRVDREARRHVAIVRCSPDEVVSGANTLEVELRGSGFLDTKCEGANSFVSGGCSSQAESAEDSVTSFWSAPPLELSVPNLPPHDAQRGSRDDEVQGDDRHAFPFELRLPNLFFHNAEQGSRDDEVQGDDHDDFTFHG